MATGLYTSRAWKVLEAAASEARALGHGYLGSEHLLLGMTNLFDDPQADGPRLLHQLGVSAQAIRERVSEWVPPDTESGTGRETLQINPHAAYVLEWSLQVSMDLGHDRVGTEHLLLGLLYERDGAAALALRSFGTTYESVRDLVKNGEDGEYLHEAPNPASVSALPLVPTPAVRRTSGAARVSELARQQAEQDTSFGGRVGTQHYLLASIMEPESLASRALASFGLSYNVVAARVNELSAYDSVDAPGHITPPPAYHQEDRQGEEITVSKEELEILLTRLPELLPANSRIYWNLIAGGDSAYVRTNEGIDLKPYVQRVLTDSGM